MNSINSGMNPPSCRTKVGCVPKICIKQMRLHCTAWEKYLGPSFLVNLVIGDNDYNYRSFSHFDGIFVNTILNTDNEIQNDKF